MSNDQLRWQSPERVRGSDPTKASDLWSFGVLVHELFNGGRVPFRDLSVPELRAAFEVTERTDTSPRLDLTQGPALIRILLDRCQQYKPERRPSAEDVHRILQTLAHPDGAALQQLIVSARCVPKGITRNGLARIETEQLTCVERVSLDPNHAVLFLRDVRAGDSAAFVVFVGDRMLRTGPLCNQLSESRLSPVIQSYHQ